MNESLIKSLANCIRNWEKKMWKESQPRVVIIDSQAVKNTDNAREKWRCHYKCTNGIKRHLLVDVLWIPICILVTTANINDRIWWKEMVKKNKDVLKWIETMLADRWYSWKWFKISIKKTTSITVTISEKPSRKKWEWFKPEHKRWIVERSNAWMEKCRRLHKNNERYVENSATMCKICFIRLVVRRLTKLN